MTTVPSMSERISVTVSPSHLQLALGERADVAITVRNRGGFVDQFELQVEGLDPAWFTVHVSQASLFPGDEGRLELEVDLPADQAVPAGLRRVRLRVFSWHDPQQMVVVELPVEVLPVGGIELSLSPRLVRTRRRGLFRIGMTNVGNAEQVIDLSVTDAEEALDANLELDRVALAPGATEEVAFYIGPRRLQIITPPKRYPFTVTAMPAGQEVAEALATAEGTLLYQAPLAFLARLLPRLGSLVRIAAILAIVGAIAVWLIGSPGLRGAAVEAQPTRAPIVISQFPGVDEELDEEDPLDGVPNGVAAAPGVPGVDDEESEVEPGVDLPPRVALFDLAVPADAGPGELELSWEVEGADEVEIDGAPQPGEGSMRLEGPPEGEIELIARNEAGEVSRTIGILVHRAPDVLLFEASPDVVEPGASSILTWQATRAERAMLFGPGLPAEGGVVDPRGGDLEVQPESTATYRFVVDNAAGRVERRIIVAVQEPPDDGESGEPTEQTSAAPVREPLAIERFGLLALDDPSRPIPLEWQVSGATEIRVERSDPPSGRERPYQAVESTEYRLVATNEVDTLTDSFTVYVLRPPRIETFEADRVEIQAGEWVSLTWLVSGADRVFLDGEPMEALWSGVTYVQPSASHEYVLRAENAIGATTHQLLVLVNPVPWWVPQPAAAPIDPGAGGDPE